MNPSKCNYVDRFAYALDDIHDNNLRETILDLQNALDAYRRNRDASTIPRADRPFANLADVCCKRADDILQKLHLIADDIDSVREDLEAINDNMSDIVVTPPDKDWPETTTQKMNTQPQIEIKLSPSGDNAIALTAKNSDCWNLSIKTSVPNRLERCSTAEFIVPLTELRKLARFIIDTEDAFEIEDFENMVKAFSNLRNK
jgi:hypothetical protein